MGWIGVKSRFLNSSLGEPIFFFPIKNQEAGAPNKTRELLNSPARAGGEIGCDIKEGKRTILVAHVCSKCTKREKEKLFKILNKGRDKVTKEDISWVIDLYGKYGSIEYARQKARQLVEEGKSAIKDLPEKAKDIFSIANFVVERKI